MNEDLPTDLGRRVGNLDDLPIELREQLVVGKTDELVDALVGGLRRLGGIANLDELLVQVYHLTGVVHKRTFLSNKLYRMSQGGVVESVPKKKGVYRLPDT